MPRHQALSRWPEKPHKSEDRHRAQENDPDRRQAVDREPHSTAEKPREERQPFAEARDYRLDQPGLHNDVEYSYDRQRQPHCALVPVITKAGVEHEDAWQDLMGEPINEVDGRETEQFGV